MSKRYHTGLYPLLAAVLLTVLLLPPSPVLAANKPGTRDLVYEEDEPAKAPQKAADRDLGPGPYLSLNKQQNKIITDTLEKAEALRQKGQKTQALQLVSELVEACAELSRPLEPKLNFLIYDTLYHSQYSLGRLQEAEKAAEKMLGLAQMAYAPDSSEVLDSKDTLARTLQQLNRNQEALDLQAAAFNTRLKKFGPFDAGTLVAGDSLAQILEQFNSYDVAIDLCNVLLEAARKKPPKALKRVFQLRLTLADLLQDVGDYEAAEKEIRSGLAAMDKTGKNDPVRGWYRSYLERLAFVLTNGPKKDYAQAAKLLGQVRQMILKEQGPEHPNNLVGELNYIAALTEMKENLAESRRNMEALLPKIARAFGEETPAYATAARLLARLRRESGDPAGAVALLQDVLSLTQDFSDQQQPLYTAIELSKAFQANGDLETAAFFGRQAVNTGQSIRRGLKDALPSMQKSFAARMTESYQTLADVLMAQGKTAEAQKVMAMLKESELADMAIGAEAPKRSAQAVPAGSSAGAAAPAAAGGQQTDLLAGMDPKVAGRYQEISDKIVALGKEQRALLDKRSQGEELSPQEEERLKTLRQDMTAARKAFTAFMKNLSTELGQGDKRAADLGNLETYQRLLASLGDGVVLLQTIVTDNRIWLILTTQNSQVAKQSPFDVKGLPEKITAFRDVLQDPEKDSRPLAKELYDAVVGPLAPALEQAGTKMIMFSLDGQLRYIPMSALYDGKQWLIQKYNVSLFNDATKAGLAVPGVGNWKVAGLGVSKEHKYGRGTFTALPAVKDELASIVRTRDNASGALNGTMTLDEGFTADKLQEVLETGYPVIHLASHFHFDKKNPEKSFLLLGDGNGLPLTQIESEDFKFKNVDLLALSACQTARGGVDADGKEIEGFGALAQKRGAKAVLATLWPVFDESTGLLMSNFYRLHEGKDKPGIAGSLREAQLQMIDRKIQGKDFSQPFYWAPFVLMGDWR
ncbi:MAG: CHAT domain-containing protein [Desulfovibrio sp.]|nr:CHAT domain-containing protein [Desulfovibrio sp.]